MLEMTAIVDLEDVWDDITAKEKTYWNKVKKQKRQQWKDDE